MLVFIVYAVDADRRGPDLERMNRVEDVDDDLGRLLLQTGEARQPTDEERAAFETARASGAPAEEPQEKPVDDSEPTSATAKKTTAK
jgi:Mrp family chromosome partitioning ATPase